MVGRQMVGQRKGLPPNPPQHDTSDTGADDSRTDDSGAENGADDSDDATCPNCQCVFNEETQAVVKPGLKVAGHEAGYQGADLDVSGSAEPIPGRLGTAHDAAMGSQVMGNLLAGFRGHVR